MKTSGNKRKKKSANCERGHSAATRLISLTNEFLFFHDGQNRPFVRIEIDSHTEVWPAESSHFRRFLARIYHDNTGEVINRSSLADATTTLAGRACYDGPEEPVFLRVAPHNENILIDLCDAEWRVIEVTREGFKILPSSPVAFIRTGAMQPLPVPKGNGTLDPLWKILNVAPEQRPLIAGALLNYFHPEGPYFVLNFVGEQGTAKSSAARMVRQLIDPSANPLRSPPREERDLIAQATSNWCVAVDNLSHLQHWFSDALCRLATGGGHSARALYTDLEEISISVKRPVLINGIEDVASRPDLAERALQVELQTISDDRRISERQLWEQFEQWRPTIFSALLGGLSSALRDSGHLNLKTLPRMADAAEWATAGETALGWERGTFIAAYTQNLDEAAVSSVEAHPVGLCIRQLLEEEADWSGEPAELLEILSRLLSEDQRRSAIWPKNPRALSACLRRLAPALRRARIQLDSGRGRRRQIRLSKLGNLASSASPDRDFSDANDANDAKLQRLQRSQNDPAEPPELVEELI